MAKNPVVSAGLSRTKVSHISSINSLAASFSEKTIGEEMRPMPIQHLDPVADPWSWSMHCVMIHMISSSVVQYMRLSMNAV